MHTSPLPPSSHCLVVTHCSVSSSLSCFVHHSLLTLHLFIPTHSLTLLIRGSETPDLDDLIDELGIVSLFRVRLRQMLHFAARFVQGSPHDDPLELLAAEVGMNRGEVMRE